MTRRSFFLLLIGECAGESFKSLVTSSNSCRCAACRLCRWKKLSKLVQAFDGIRKFFSASNLISRKIIWGTSMGREGRFDIHFSAFHWFTSRRCSSHVYALRSKARRQFGGLVKCSRVDSLSARLCSPRRVKLIVWSTLTVPSVIPSAKVSR